MNFVGKALKLTGEDVRIIAGYLGVQIATVRAVVAVEAGASGFGPGGRPLILFEPHVFYRELGAGAKRDRAVREGLAYAKWGAKPYPKAQADRYSQLEKAMAIDETAALRSASWGMGQVMGFNHLEAGFVTVQRFVEAMTYSEGAQLYAMARFIVSKNLQRHLRSFAWAAFARGYNGAGYKKNAYDTKLAAAYARRPASEKIVPPPATSAELDAVLGRGASPAPAKPVPVPEPRPAPDAAPEPSVAETGGKEESVSHSTRFWTWLSTGGAGAVSLSGLADIDVWLQRAIGLLLIGLALYAILTMPAIRKKLGLKT